MRPPLKLLRWYDRHGRRLPWRKTRDPYKILVSEVMLQQTQVSRVIPFYKNWLKQFPNWHALAYAPSADVIRAWQGLGYNRRALMLQNIAREIAKNGVPKSRDEWLALKGIGPYTSAALTAFSLRQPAFPVDTNIRRVAGRFLLGKTFPILKDDARIERAALRSPLTARRFHDIPQALFDLANAHCAKLPDCTACPLRSDCRAAPKFLKGNIRVPKRTVAKNNERIREGKKYPDRIYRGRILKLVQSQASGVPMKSIGSGIDPSFNESSDAEWVESMIRRLQKDKLVDVLNERVILPKH